MKFVADLHLHSKYSRAVSQQMTLENMEKWARYKGIAVLATGDFTHPFWFDKLKNELEEAGNGLYQLRKTTNDTSSSLSASRELTQKGEEVYFLLSCEISSIYTQGGKNRRIHNLFFFPSLSSVEKFNSQLLKRGANLRSDGRPIVGISAADLAAMALEVDEKALVIPAHVWTPWFSVFGAFSGFDSLKECFGDLTGQIYAIETGLSSDPAMNWRVEELEDKSILSFSDAHSLEKMGREATVFEAAEVSYDSIYDAIRSSGNWESRTLGVNKPSSLATQKPSSLPRIAFTIEFYPEEGKYHFTGHRDCNISFSPDETAKRGDICPVCSRQLTIGVMHRVEQLASRTQNLELRTQNALRWVNPADDSRPPYVWLVPLAEILAEALGSAPGTKKAMDQYMALVNGFGSEFNVLLKADLGQVAKMAPPRVAEGIKKVRAGEIIVEPGYDGKYGVVKIWLGNEGHQYKTEIKTAEERQLNLFT